jgi:adenylosuccinate lyase
VRSTVIPAMENVPLWHERDISHSSVERFIAPDATITLDFAQVRAAGLIEKIVVNPDRMLRNLNHAGGVVHSGRVLLALTQKGVSREDGYRIVQANAMRALKGDGAFRDLLKADPEVAQRLGSAELEALFDLEHHFSEVDTIFARVFSEVHR